MADQARDVLDRHAVIGQQRDEAVPQLAGRPLLRGEPGRLSDLTEVAPPDGQAGGRPHLILDESTSVDP
jgi:hypothetical protein